MLLLLHPRWLYSSSLVVTLGTLAYNKASQQFFASGGCSRLHCRKGCLQQDFTAALAVGGGSRHSRGKILCTIRFHSSSSWLVVAFGTVVYSKASQQLFAVGGGSRLCRGEVIYNQASQQLLAVGGGSQRFGEKLIYTMLHSSSLHLVVALCTRSSTTRLHSSSSQLVVVALVLVMVVDVYSKASQQLLQLVVALGTFMVTPRLQKASQQQFFGNGRLQQSFTAVPRTW